MVKKNDGPKSGIEIGKVCCPNEPFELYPEKSCLEIATPTSNSVISNMPSLAIPRDKANLHHFRFFASVNRT